MPPQFDAYIITSNSPQAALLANGIIEARTNGISPIFQFIGEVLAAPLLTEQSPYLNWSNSSQSKYGISDEAYEAIPAQLLPLLRPDSFGTMSPNAVGWTLQFSGSDGYAYEVQTSIDLIHWDNVSTNYPVQGNFNVAIPIDPNLTGRFYRSVLIPY